MIRGKVLAIDTSQLRAALCALEDGRLVAEQAGSIDVAHSEALLPLLHRLLSGLGWELSGLDAFAVGVGPGSFTGIRIGCATVRALAQVTGKPIYPFSSLRALALSADPGGTEEAVALVEAYQGQVFAGWRDAKGDAWQEDAVTVADWLARARPEEGCLFCGSGARKGWTELSSLPGAKLSPVEHVTAQGIARLLASSTGGPVSYQNLTANYLRPSQAEAKLSSLAQGKGAC